MAYNANELDFLGEGTAKAPAAAPPGATVNPGDANKWKSDNAKAASRDILDKTKSYGGMTGGAGIYGDGGVWDNFSDQTKDTYNYYRDIRDPSSVKDFINARGEDVGVSRAGDAAIGGVGDTFQIGTPFNTLDRVVDPEKGLGVSGQGPVTGITPGTAAAAGVLQGATPNTPGALAGAGVGGVRDALDEAMGGAGEMPYDTSGADRGGMGSYAPDFERVRGLADSARGAGAGVLGGSVAPGGAGAAGQQQVMDEAMGFAPKAQAAAQKKVDAFAPKAQTGVMGELGAFTAQAEGPSKAQLLLEDATDKSMSDALSLARSGRGRDAGSQARALNVAMAENAATQAGAARSGGLLRAQEAQDFRNQQLTALGQKGQLAQGVDQSKLGALDLSTRLAGGRDQSALQALGLGGELASQMRQGNITERGQSLGFAQGMEGIGAGMEGDVLQTIPGLENVRHQDEFDLTPQQKLAAAKMGGAPDKTTADYVTALLGDVLGAAF